MNDLLLQLERSAAAEALRTSFYVYPVVSALHVAAVGTLFASVLLMDLRLLGVIGTVDTRSFVDLLRRVALVAFGLAALSGSAMFAVRAVEYAAMGVFLAKMVLIGLAGLNFLVFMRLAGAHADRVTGLAAIAATCSILLWSGVLLAGRFVGYL